MRYNVFVSKKIISPYTNGRMESNMIEKFTHRYSLQRTLKFSLIPVGNTEKNFEKALYLKKDNKRAENYEIAKTYIDRYHRDYIEEVLKNFTLTGVEDYAVLYNKTSKSKSDKKAIDDKEKEMRTSISKALKGNERYKFFSTEKRAKFIKEEMPKFLSDDEEREIIKSFSGFTSYFTGYFTARANMYGNENESITIAHRCINDNLPKFIDNVKSYEKVRAVLPQAIAEINENFAAIYGTESELDTVFSLNSFSSVLAQSGITKYNNFIGGYSNSDGSKVKGLNEYINKYNQQDKSHQLPLMNTLFKQILSDVESISFIPEKFGDDDELLKTVNRFYCDGENGIRNVINALTELVCKMDIYDGDGIYVNSKQIASLSKSVLGDWSSIETSWKAEYERNKKGKKTENYYKKQEAEYKKHESFSINELQALCGDGGNIAEYFKAEAVRLKDLTEKTYADARSLLTNEYTDTKRLSKNAAAIAEIKAFLDSVKEFEALIKMLIGTGKETYRENAFYGEFLPYYEKLKAVDGLYNKVRNHITKKPYSKEKIKLTFENTQFLVGWDIKKEETYKSAILRKDGKFYLAIAKNKDTLKNAPEADTGGYEKIIYKQIQNTSKYFSIKQIGPQNPPEHILKWFEKDFDKKTLSKEQLTEMIRYTVEDFIPNYKELNDENGNCYFDFKFKDYAEYTSWNDFMNDIQPYAYKIRFKSVSEEYINEMTEKGELYLFQIYNKDFSECSIKNNKKPNLHTLYFRMLFNEKNLENIVYWLCGGAEMFYREPTIKADEMTVHPANEPIKNKNPQNKKTHSTFAYDLIKDKRFTKRQFSLHMPVAFNLNCKGGDINGDILESIRASEKQRIIGIDRGERNLIYASVIDETGKILEQKSFNLITSDNDYKVDYNALLEAKGDKNSKARKEWQEIETIKELKEGYISQAVHEICKLVVKYDAIIALENLNMGFINSRKKIDKQVYQKLETMLTSKLRYLADKSVDPDNAGGLLNAYQLTNEAPKTQKELQNGILFYVPAWLTSKIDPVTGFVDLLKPKYQNVEAAKAFMARFDSIRYNREEDIFEFEFDYGKFPKCNADCKKKWTVYTNGERIKTFRNPAKNNQWDNETVVLTEEFKKLFNEYGVDLTADLKEKISEINEKAFFEKLLRCLALTLQMRNSITGNVDIDYLISPVKNSDGVFYDSRNYTEADALPCNADANGAYNIARKALLAIKELKASDDTEIKLAVSNAEWLKYAQSHE